MIDIHTHILPGIDDGADSLEEAYEMALMAVRSGMKGLVAVGAEIQDGESPVRQTDPQLTGEGKNLRTGVIRPSVDHGVIHLVQLFQSNVFLRYKTTDSAHKDCSCVIFISLPFG